MAMKRIIADNTDKCSYSPCQPVEGGKINMIEIKQQTQDKLGKKIIVNFSTVLTEHNVKWYSMANKSNTTKAEESTNYVPIEY